MRLRNLVDELVMADFLGHRLRLSEL